MKVFGLPPTLVPNTEVNYKTYKPPPTPNYLGKKFPFDSSLSKIKTNFRIYIFLIYPSST